MLTVNPNDGSHISFKMSSQIERQINFFWVDIMAKIESDWKEKKVVAFIDSNVYELNDRWADLEASHLSLHLIPTNLNEAEKSVDSLLACLDRIESIGFSRRADVLLAIGGGVLMDLVSLAANLYRRGVSVVKVPTTLLGFVDASIGIKTGVNFKGQRNRLGTYYLNYDVMYDQAFLSTLGVDLIREGLGEIFKIAIIKSKELFELLERYSEEILTTDFFQSDSGARVISLAVELMLEELHENPTESNLRRCVDFGHTFSPFVEMQSIQNDSFSPIPHGLAVGADCVITAIISRNRGCLSDSDLNRILALADVIDFAPTHPIYEHYDLMWSSLVDMTAHRGGDQNLPYPTSLGKFDFIQDLQIAELTMAVDEFRGVR